jgi:hypothetical protein
MMRKASTRVVCKPFATLQDTIGNAQEDIMKLATKALGIALCVLCVACGAQSATAENTQPPSKKTPKTDPYVGEWWHKNDRVYIKAVGTAYTVQGKSSKRSVATMANGALHLSGALFGSADILHVPETDTLIAGGVEFERVKYLEGTVVRDTNDVLLTKSKDKIGITATQDGGSVMWGIGQVGDIGWVYPGDRIKVAYLGGLKIVTRDIGFSSTWESNNVKHYVVAEEITVQELSKDRPKE